MTFSVENLLIGNSAAMKRLREMIGLVANSDASVLICGPSGAGKELVARAIHELSTRSRQSYVSLNCGAIPSELIESELFGHEKGAFTGAHARRLGRFEEAHNGTLFLDEIGDMPFDMQVKLLRVLEDGVVRRVGGAEGKRTNVRVVAATHQNLETAVREKRFREDLYFRLGVIPLAVPSLAERTEDIPEIIAHFVAKSPAQKRVRFSKPAIERLARHDWPGNVRELRNFVERAQVLYAGREIGGAEADLLLTLQNGTRAFGQPSICRIIDDEISFDDDKDDIIVEMAAPVPAPVKAAPVNADADLNAPIDLKLVLEKVELENIEAALRRADGVISDAARLLSLKRTTLVEKMRKYGVQRCAA